MRALYPSRSTLGLLAIAGMLWGCALPPSLPKGQDEMPPGALVHGANHTARAARAPSWMAPEAKNDDLLYVSDNSGSVYAYSYPAGKLVGTLTGFKGPGGVCSDKTGDVFVTDTPALEIYEYKHGGKKPLTTLGDFGYYPEGCASDPKTGNLAVTNYASTKSIGPGSVSIYTNASGRGTTYSLPSFASFFFCGYDNKSNLFVDGVDYGTTHAEFAELPSGATTLTQIAVNQSILYPGGIQWDGKDVAIEDNATSVLYRVKIAGSAGTVVGTTQFNGAHSDLVTQFWLDGSAIILPYGSLDRNVRKVGLWPYPGGGKATKILHPPGAVELFGATVSLAPKSK